MQTAEKKQADWAVLWQEERQTLSLQGEPVLEYALVRPQIRDGGRADGGWTGIISIWRRSGAAGGAARSTGMPVWTWPAAGSSPVHSIPGRPTWRAGSCFRTRTA